ncbi:hypothetical protein PRZ48_003643 [Zasmidium cellare]|uniref:protein-tyrosine-phosphatase n=1 Tax=Zasmidium cellare TaxID=395010 RepID=A0ABR0EX74_ZASCE|nr:hypothetical protein PRZ48_003643 [Zasmidium cellare]
MGWVDKVPRAGNLYIGGLHALYQRQDLFKEYKITHIISALDFDLYEAGHFKEYAHIQVKLDDDPNENFFAHTRRFRDTNDFIESALSNGGAVFVHCAMGKSRSATIVIAYLMYKYHISPTAALAQLNEGRPVCEPNPGFQEQLEVYHDMLRCDSEADANRVYDQWLKTRYTGDWYSERRREISKL